MHDTVKRTLQNSGWTITDDPFTISFGRRTAYADLGAEELLGAEREGRKIVVEIKSFIAQSPLTELERALGQYLIYRSWLSRLDPSYTVYLALDERSYVNMFTDAAGQVLIEDYGIRLVVVSIEREEIVKWID